jgi:hypothetical protein
MTPSLCGIRSTINTAFLSPCYISTKQSQPLCEVSFKATPSQTAARSWHHSAQRNAVLSAHGPEGTSSSGPRVHGPADILPIWQDIGDILPTWQDIGNILPIWQDIGNGIILPIWEDIGNVLSPVSEGGLPSEISPTPAKQRSLVK